MSIADVIKSFSGRETVPIDVEEVFEAIKKFGKIREIYWFPVDINPEVVRGFIHTWSYPNEWEYTSDPSGVYIAHCADIYYSSRDTVDWQRLVCAKEAGHLLDYAGSCVSTEAQIDLLIDKIVLPPELYDAATAGPAANRDRAAELQALALLFPMAARNLLLPRYRERKLTLADIARLTDLPLRYMSFLMSEKWDEIHARFLGAP